GFVNHGSQLVWSHVGKALASLDDGLIEETPLDCILDEFRERALLQALRTEIGAQGQVSILRPGDGQAGDVSLRHGHSIRVYQTIGMYDYTLSKDQVHVFG